MTARALTSVAGVCVTVMLAALVVALVSASLGLRTGRVASASIAGLAAFGGAYTLGRAHEAIRHERTPR